MFTIRRLCSQQAVGLVKPHAQITKRAAISVRMVDCNISNGKRKRITQKYELGNKQGIHPKV
jgi:hypothetical protein